MSNTKVDISLKSKGDPTVNLTIIEAPEISESSSSSPVINFIATGAQGPTGVQGQDGVAEISTGQITSDHLSSNSVGQDEIANGSVTYNKLAASSVRGNRISSSAITSSKIANGAVTQSKLAQNSVGTDQIINGTITAELLQDLTIIGDKLEDLGISTGKLQDLIITTSKLRDRNVTGIKIAENADLDGEVKVHNLKLKGYSPAVITGPDSDALHIKSNQTIDFLNSSGVTIATLDQNGNLSISGTVDGRDIASDGVKLDGIADNEIIDWTTDQGSVNINPGNYTDTVYTHPSSHPISLIAGLQTSLNSKTTLSAFNAAVSGLQSDINAKQDAIGNEDLTIQQTDGLQDALDAKVDDSQVLTNVPASALFTDTVYSLPVAGTAIGGVKEGGDIDIDADGNMTLKSSGSTINSPGWANPSANNLVQSGTTGTTNITFDVTTKGAPSTATWGIFTIDHTGSSLPGLEVRVWATNSFSGGGAKVFKNNSDKSQDIAGQFFCPIVSSNCRIRVIIWSPDPDQFHVHFMGWI